MNNDILSYKELFKSVKYQIVTSRNKAINSVNRELILLYWNIGNIILKNQEVEGWGSKVILNLSKDFKSINVINFLY